MMEKKYGRMGKKKGGAMGRIAGQKPRKYFDSGDHAMGAATGTTVATKSNIPKAAGLRAGLTAKSNMNPVPAEGEAPAAAEAAVPVSP